MNLSNCTVLFAAALTDYGWTRENNKLAVVWELPDNIEKATASLNFIMSGCKCKTGCSTRRCSCQRKKRVCGPSCQCINCSNFTQSSTAVDTRSPCIDLEVEDLLSEPIQEEYVEESDDDLQDERNDDELEDIMEFVFGPETDEEDAS